MPISPSEGTGDAASYSLLARFGRSPSWLLRSEARKAATGPKSSAAGALRENRVFDRGRTRRPGWVRPRARPRVHPCADLPRRCIEEGGGDAPAASLWDNVKLLNPQRVAVFFDADDLVGEDDADGHSVDLRQQ